jgi:hypothetical protein
MQKSNSSHLTDKKVADMLALVGWREAMVSKIRSQED